ncbi:hypothetical protein Tsubulata_027155 [Turnera subulata]|uniref:1-acyl-sn-glycerol-3-phosphate acyltransferase n=1 Tax=Turnera subulata TaxID=218843 RepID=A0A9Q0J7Q0_9ROSI|nr:hypothetical protein Tsubulata_027155 [Turnera subulata]
MSRSHFGHKQHKQNKVPRDMVVRSELAGTSIPNSSHSLSGFSKAEKFSQPFSICFSHNLKLTAFFSNFKIQVQKRTLCQKIKFEGLENLPPTDTPAVYVSNHQSFLDIYALLTLGRGFKFISKTSIFLFPIIGWAMLLLGTIPLKRMDSRSQLDCLKRCIDLVNKGASVLFFPEGTRSKDGNLGTFKKGAFSVAAKTGVPVIPITLIGTGKIMPAGMEGILNSGSVRVVVHKPIEGSDPTVLCNKAQNAVASAL